MFDFFKLKISLHFLDGEGLTFPTVPVERHETWIRHYSTILIKPNNCSFSDFLWIMSEREAFFRFNLVTFSYFPSRLMFFPSSWLEINHLPLLVKTNIRLKWAGILHQRNISRKRNRCWGDWKISPVHSNQLFSRANASPRLAAEQHRAGRPTGLRYIFETSCVSFTKCYLKLSTLIHRERGLLRGNACHVT